MLTNPNNNKRSDYCRYILKFTTSYYRISKDYFDFKYNLSIRHHKFRQGNYQQRKPKTRFNTN